MTLRLTLERRARGLSQTKLAQRADISPSILSRIVTGRTHIWPGWKERLARALDWEGDQDALFEEVDDEQ